MNVVKEFFKRLQPVDGPRTCRTRKISDTFFECKVRKPNPNYCEYSRCSGESFVCSHQDRERFAGR